jgi:hypothetical protein
LLARIASNLFVSFLSFSNTTDIDFDFNEKRNVESLRLKSETMVGFAEIGEETLLRPAAGSSKIEQ